jgi:hypothetical protein
MAYSFRLPHIRSNNPEEHKPYQAQSKDVKEAIKLIRDGVIPVEIAFKDITTHMQNEFEVIIDSLEAEDIHCICDIMVHIISNPYLDFDKIEALWVLIMLTQSLVHAANYLKT